MEKEIKPAEVTDIPKYKCHICGTPMDGEDYGYHCSCFAGCSDPGYHRGEACDGSC